MMWSHERSLFLALGTAEKFKGEKGVRHRARRRIHRAHRKTKAANKHKALVLEVEPRTTRDAEKTCGGSGEDAKVSTSEQQSIPPPPSKQAVSMKRKIAVRRDATVHHRWCSLPLSCSDELDQTDIKKPRLSFESTSS
jgi:hypothetical protein